MIQVGDKVRSFDFAETFDDGTQIRRELEGKMACYVEGIVTAINKDMSYHRYEIVVNRDVFGGKESERRVGNVVYPPVNGTPGMFSVCDGVELASEHSDSQPV